MKFCDVQDALMAGKKVKLSNWKTLTGIMTRSGRKS